MTCLTGEDVLFETQIVSNDGILVTAERKGKFIDFGLKASVDNGGYSPSSGSYTVAIIMYLNELFLVEIEKIRFPNSHILDFQVIKK